MNELYHHGILGQQWGKRNGPPYPLDAGDHSARENNAGWRKSIDKSSETTKTKKGLSDKQKKAIIIGASVAAAGLAAYGIYKYRSIPKSNPLTPEQMKALGFQVFEYEKFEPERIQIDRVDISKVYTPNKGILSYGADEILGDTNKAVTTVKSLRDKILVGANPSHGKSNCSSVSLSVFLKEKGLNFSSKDIGGQNLYGVIESCFKNIPERDLRESRGITKYFTSYESASSKLKEWYGQNANGVISIPFKLPTGKITAHTFNWSIKDGVVEFFDGQPDPPLRNITSYFKHVDIEQLLTVAHLDNLEINEQGILQYLDK